MPGSIAVLDESGDAGRRPGQGSSDLFVVALVVFGERAEAERCSDRIDQVKAELNRPAQFEFHFRRDSHATRKAFLACDAPFQFSYHVAVGVKRALSVPSADLIYAGACARLFASAKPDLQNATIVVDGGGDRGFRRRFSSVVRAQAATIGGHDIVAAVKVQPSEPDNLLQLADYVAGVMHRSRLGRRGGHEYRDVIVRHEAATVTWTM